MEHRLHAGEHVVGHRRALALGHRHDGVAALLLERGHPPERTSRGPEQLINLALLPTRLCHAAGSGDVNELTRLLDAHPAHVSESDYDDRTALHVAVCQDQREAVTLLLARGAKTTAKDHWGHTPADDAKRLDNQKMQALLAASLTPSWSPRGN